MEAVETRRNRFIKRSNEADEARRRPFNCLKAVFTTFHLEDLENELSQWQRLAISNEMSAYSTGESREDLMDFCESFIQVIDALHNLLALHEQSKGIDSEYGRREEIYSMEQSLNALKQFYTGFDIEYCKTELFDMLDAVITYSGERQVYKGTILVFYNCLNSLLAVGHVLNFGYSLRNGDTSTMHGK